MGRGRGARRWGAVAAAAALLVVTAGCETDQELDMYCDGVHSGESSQHIHTSADEWVYPGDVATLHITSLTWPQYVSRGESGEPPLYTGVHLAFDVNADIGHILDIDAVGGNMVTTAAWTDGRLAQINLQAPDGQPFPPRALPGIVVRVQTHALAAGGQLTWEYRGFNASTVPSLDPAHPLSGATICQLRDNTGRFTPAVAVNHTNVRFPGSTP